MTVDEARTFPYEANPGSTHWDGCWKAPRHHNCAVAEVYRLQEERSRYEGLLAAASEALRENITTWITLQPMLNEPYPDDPRWTPWTRFGKRAADIAVEAKAAIRVALARSSNSAAEERQDG